MAIHILHALTISNVALEGDKVTNTGMISLARKVVARNRMHPTFLATHLLKMLNSNRMRSIELKPKLYT
jgi:hypothetical protein